MFEVESVSRPYGSLLHGLNYMEEALCLIKLGHIILAELQWSFSH